jgi:hypothetical protein
MAGTSCLHTILLLSWQTSPWIFACIKILSHTHFFSLHVESGGETENRSSDTSDSSIIEKSSMHVGVNHSEADPPVPKEDLVLFDHFDDQSESVPSLCIAVIGATGELARTKVFPALFALYYSGFLPRVCMQHVIIYAGTHFLTTLNKKP